MKDIPFYYLIACQVLSKKILFNENTLILITKSCLRIPALNIGWLSFKVIFCNYNNPVKYLTHFVYYYIVIKIKEDEKTPLSKVATTIHVVLENNDEKTFYGYPISLTSADIKPLTFKLEKSAKSKYK